MDDEFCIVEYLDEENQLITYKVTASKLTPIVHSPEEATETINVVLGEFSEPHYVLLAAYVNETSIQIDLDPDYIPGHYTFHLIHIMPDNPAIKPIPVYEFVSQIINDEALIREWFEMICAYINQRTAKAIVSKYYKP